MKIAVLIRGQFREWNNAKHSLFKALNPFEEHHDITYFFATWETSYFALEPTPDGVIEKCENLVLSAADIDRIHQDFSGKSFFLEIVSVEKALKLFDGLELQEEYHQISYIRHIVGMMKQNYEIENDCYFDVVVETRPDIFILPYEEDKIPVAELIPNFVFHSASEYLTRGQNIIYSDRGFYDVNTLFVDDLIFISNGLTSDIITGEFCFLFHNRKLSFFKNIHAHHLLCDYLLNFKLINTHNVGKFFKNIDIVRPLSFFDLPVNFLNVTDETLELVSKAHSNFSKLKIKNENNLPNGRPRQQIQHTRL